MRRLADYTIGDEGKEKDVVCGGYIKGDKNEEGAVDSIS